MVLPPSRLAFGGPPIRRAARPPLPLLPGQSAHCSPKTFAPSAALPLPGGRLLPSGRMLMSHAAKSFGLIGLPSRGLSARAAAPSASTRPAAIASLRIDMLHLALGVDAPARHCIEVVAGESEHRRRLGGVAAPRHELLPRRLRAAAFVPGAALQHRGAAVPPPRHAEAGEGLRQPRLVERRLAPALAAVGGDHHLVDAAVAGIGDAGD